MPSDAQDTRHERILLMTEIDYVAACLQNDEVDFAQAHLDIIRQYFPDQIAVIWYYQGIIDFQNKAYASAAPSFERLLNESLLPENEREVYDYLVRAYSNLGRFDDAARLLAEITHRFKDAEWTKTFPLIVGAAMYERASDDPEQRDLRSRALKHLVRFADENTGHSHAAWIKYVQAEHEFEWLEKRLAKISHDGGSLRNAGVLPHLQRIAAMFEHVEKTYAASEYALNAEFRLVYLKELVEAATPVPAP